MTRFQLRFAADGSHEETTRDFDKRDGSFVFWLTETKDGREFDIIADAQPLCRLRRSRACGRGVGSRGSSTASDVM